MSKDQRDAGNVLHRHRTVGGSDALLGDAVARDEVVAEKLQRDICQFRPLVVDRRWVQGCSCYLAQGTPVGAVLVPDVMGQHSGGLVARHEQRLPLRALA